MKFHNLANGNPYLGAEIILRLLITYQIWDFFTIEPVLARRSPPSHRCRRKILLKLPFWIFSVKFSNVLKGMF